MKFYIAITVQFFRGMQQTEGCVRYCFGCGRNMTCFLEQLHNRMLTASKSWTTRIGYNEVHMIPQNWLPLGNYKLNKFTFRHCDFRSRLSSYTLLRYDNDPTKMFSQLSDYLQKRNISQKALEFIERSITNQRTEHSTVDLTYRIHLQERIKSSPYLMNLVKRIYFYDYKLFGYQMT
jgi:hypothetical protein